MGHSTLIPMLALNISDLVFYGFMAVFVVGPWIAKTLKQVGATNRPQQPPPPSDTQAPTTQTTRTPRAADLARRRREKLEALTRNRDLPSQASARSLPQEPGNLTMTQRVQRARAKALYEQRIQQLKQGKTPTTPKPPAAPTHSAPSRIPSQPHQEIDQIRRQARAQKKRQLDAARRKATQTQTLAHRHSKKLSQTMRLEPVPPVPEENQVRRHVPDAPMPGAQAGPRPRIIKHLNTASLRQAIILKEVLDRPLALRPPAGELPNFDMNQNPY